MRQRITRRELLKAGGASLAAATSAGCLSLVDGGSKNFVVSSKDFTEQFILSNVSIVLLEEAGHSVEDKTGLGGSPANFRALKNGDADLYWEYTGTAWSSILDKDEEFSDPDKLYEEVDSAYNEQHDVDWLQYAPFNNTYVIVANPDWAEENGLESLPDLADHVNDGNTDIKIAMNPEIKERDDAWGGLPEAYGFADAADELETVNMKLGLAYEAVANNEVQLGFGFNTNPNIQKFDLPTLEDTKNFFVIYNPAPNVRTEKLTDDVKATLNEPVEDLTTETQRELNAKVSIDEEEPKTVAREFLEENGYL